MRVTLSAMARVHDVLKWANRREVAREVTKRGYRVSGETLNRWVRDEQEFPAVVERIVFELFTIGGHEEAPRPGWAEGLEARVADSVAKRLVDEDGIQALVEQTARLAYERVLDEQPPAGPAPGKRVTPPARAAREPRR